MTFPRLKKSLAVKFGAMAVAAVVLPAATISTSLVVIGRRSLKETIYAQQSETAHRVASRVSGHVRNVQSVLQTAADEPGISRASRSNQEAFLQRLLKWQPTFKEAMFIGPDGRETAKAAQSRSGPGSGGRLVHRAGRPEFSVPVLQKKVYVGEPFFSADRLPYLMISCPTDGGRGALVAKVSLENLWDLVQEVGEDWPGIAYVVDPKGVLLAHPDALRVLMHTNMQELSAVRAFREGRTGRESFGTHQGERGENVLSVVEAVPGLGWGVVVENSEESAYAPIRKMQLRVIQWTLLSVAVILALALWRVRAILRPIRILEEGVRKISHGQLDLDLRVRTGDELEVLAESFTAMARSLRELEELRRDLISMIVHDLKSPLSAIMGGIDYLVDLGSSESPDSAKKILRLAKKSSEDLLAMIQNLLDVAKMEEGKLELKREKVPLAGLLDECAESFRIQIEKESKTLRKDFAPGLPDAAVDVQLIRRVLQNFLSNAVRHTASGGRITLACRPGEGGAEIVVEDDGEGIPEGYREKIFDKFVQAERKRVHLRSGTGLGLTFCKMAIELHGGSITVDSEVGRGSAFKFTLPLESSPAPAPAPAGADGFSCF
ncbi:MAG: hypothetical protein A2636_01195 [Elusimicrobia bacterium RIFCSPHIGHO2_01_FULL_64_10]|nr:MAG: hypothetical protein A2636_01195 [Elusimicrobia bacterium RIFCSPHIGHO2_01_FULL_64_10]